ncbi:MAG: hypothetical protein DYG89_53985 [Caldilinea sp. CFX5]|nr:hypothetical protein [Caldilinea sp. CFX5]
MKTLRLHWRKPTGLVLVLLILVTGGWFVLRQSGEPATVTALVTATPTVAPTADQRPSPLPTVDRDLRIDATNPVSTWLNVAVDTAIEIGFNRPAVILGENVDQQQLPHPVRLEPPAAGKGEWANPNYYRFQPFKPLDGGTTYRVIVDPFVGMEERTLRAAHTFTFTTALPYVTGSEPNNAYAHPRRVITIQFDQAMDVDSTRAAFTLQELSTKRLIRGNYSWADGYRTLRFFPSDRLKFDEIYLLNVAQSAMPASRRGGLQQPYRSQFATLPLPYVATITPGKAATGVPVDGQITIQFSTAMSETSVLNGWRITPTITNTQVYSNYSPYEYSLTLNWTKEPATTYTVTLDAAITDAYGNRLGDTIKAGVPISPTGADKATSFHFTTGDLPAFARLNIDQLTHFSVYTDTFVGLYYRNITASQVTLYQVPLSEFVRVFSNQSLNNGAGYQPADPVEQMLWTKRYELAATRNVIQALPIKLRDEAGKRLPPGLYLLTVTDPDPQQNTWVMPQLQALIVLSNHNLVVKKATQGQSLAWLTDFRSGQPVANRSLNFLVNGFLQSSVATDDEGLARAGLQLNQQQGNWPVVAVSGEPGRADFAIGATDWNQGITLSDFNLPYRNYDEKHILHFFTDRPLYRPGQRVYWKGIIRRWRGEEYQLPAEGSKVLLQLIDSRGTIIAQATPAISRFGTVDGFFDLNPEALTGGYYLNATFTYGPNYQLNTSANFLVAAYRKPEFDISVQSDQDEVQQGDPIRITTEATYFSGGPVTGATVHWRLVAAPHTFTWQAPNADRFYRFAPFDPHQLGADPYANFLGGLVKEGDGVIDESGRFVLELPADLGDSVFSQRWTVDVTVQSRTNQFVNRAATLLVHRGDYYVGISPRSYVLAQGKANQIDFLTLQPDGAPYPQATLDVTLYEYQWNPVRKRQSTDSYLWENTLQRIETLTATVQTDRNGVAQLPWTPAKGGQYLLTVRSADRHGNPINSAQTLWVSDDVGSYVAWPQANHDRLELVADKALYRPGETAHILVPSPWQGKVKALVTIERGGVLDAHTLDLTSNSSTIDVPILADYVPSAYVSVVLVRAGDKDDPVPAMRIGYTQLKVDSSAKALQIAVQPSAIKVLPGATVQYTLTVRHADGAVAPNSEVTVALIDKAVLALRPMVATSLLDLFYYERGLGVTTGATIIINRDRLSQQIGRGQKGGGGGGGGGWEVRSEFPDVAWWRADYVTDARGQGRFTVTLPDNLTRWVLLVKALDQKTYVGEASQEIVATKDLQVRPLAPRFLTAGDSATVGSVLVNATDHPLTAVAFAVAVEGATLGNGQQQVTMTLAANSQHRLLFPISVTLPVEQVVLTMTARAPATATGQALSDAVRLVIPVKRFITAATFASAGTVPTTTLQVPLTLPQAVAGDAELLVKLQDSLADSMVDGLTYLEHYPYECNEQAISRFLPNLFTVRAFRDLGLHDAALERQLNYQLAVGVQRMMSRQNPDGGWGYWPGGPSAPFTTAYVLWGLHAARHFGYPMSDDLFQQAGAFLENSYLAASTAQSWELNEAAFKHFVLADLGRGNPGDMSVLYDNRARLGVYGKAYLAMAMAQLNTPDANFVKAIDTLINEILQATHHNGDQAFWREEQPDYWSMNTDVRTSAIVVTMLLRLWPTHPILPDAVRGLLAARQTGYWGNTQETAWSLIALTDWLRATKELEGNYTWQVDLNGAALGKGVVDAQSRTQSVELRSQLLTFLQAATTETNTLTISRSNDSGQLYYSTAVRYAVDALAVAPVSQGVSVDRYFEMAGNAVNRAQVGDWLTMTVRITATQELHHLLLEVPLLAGSEPIDNRLPTQANNLNNTGEGSRTWLGANGEKVDYRPLWPSYVDTRDDKVALFATYLPAGHYYVTVPVRATLAGSYRVLPAYAEMMYFTQVMGRSGGVQLVIEEKGDAMTK